MENKHLLGLNCTSARDITKIIDTGFLFREILERPIKRVPTLTGKNIVNLFFENSTRTKISFELAEKRLSADVTNFSSSSSSVKKGEGLKDTIQNIHAMKMDCVVMRHPIPGSCKQLTNYVDSVVINAGDGTHEHPTQALLDIMSIKEKFGKISGVKVGIVGDILHSRVARSNIIILSKLGAKINVIAPKEWLPKNIRDLAVNVYTDMKKGLNNCDIVMMLRIQKERIIEKIMINQKDYFKKFGLDYTKLKYAKKNAFVMHPGPMNRGVEIDSKLADDVTRSLIQEQVAMGVAIRMACLEILIKNRDNELKY